MKRHARYGSFTLVELLVVIAILGLLAGLLLPTLAASKATSRRTSCQSQLRQLAAAFIGYTADADGGLPWSWNYTAAMALTNASAATCFQTTFTNGPKLPYTGQDLGYLVYNYLNSAAVYSCPSLLNGAPYTPYGNLAEKAPKPFYTNSAVGAALVYPHYRQNPYFGHTGWGGGNIDEFGGTNTGSTYPVSTRMNLARKPDSTVLNFDASPFATSSGSTPAVAGDTHRYAVPYVISPAYAAAHPGGSGSNPALPSFYSSDFYVPNIGFMHGSPNTYIGNFSYLDGHVGTLTSAILTDTTDYVFILKK